MGEPRLTKEPFWTRHFGVPQAVRDATRIALTIRAPRADTPYREAPPPTQRGGVAQLLDRSVIASERSQAVAAYWAAQSVLWIAWLFLALFISCAAIIGLLFATGVFP
jgi:hypothetical protein